MPATLFTTPRACPVTYSRVDHRDLWHRNQDWFWATVYCPFVKRFAPCYRTVVCPVCLSVTLVYCGQTAGWIEIPLGMEVGLVPGHIVSDGDPAPPEGHSPQFSTHLYCGQTVAHLSNCWALVSILSDYCCVTFHTHSLTAAPDQRGS